MKNIKNQSGVIHFAVIGVLLLTVVVISAAFFGVYKNITSDQQERTISNTSDNNKTALEAYKQSSGSTISESKPNSTTQQTIAAPKNSNPATVVVGNSNPSVKPTLPPAVNQPASSLDSVRTFFSAVKTGDFITANALMGTNLASTFATISSTVDASQALSSCKATIVCNIALNSFNPPSSGYTITPFTSNGIPAEQISFLLSASAPDIVAVIGTDANIDIFLENYQGVWVITNVYADGRDLLDYISNF